MTQVEFQQQFQDLLMAENCPDMQTKLNDVQEWDSLSKMSFLVFAKKEFGKILSFEMLNQVDTVEDLARLCGDLTK